MKISIYWIFSSIHFVETARSNTALVRRRLRTSELKLESFTVGEYSHTKVEDMYLENKADKKTLQTIRQRLNSTVNNIVIESGYIEKILQDNQTILFPTINHTERPDEATGSLLAGRIAIFTDGTPLSCLFRQAYIIFSIRQRINFGKSLRILRFAAFLLSLLAPSLYIAMMNHHQGLIPTSLLISLYDSDKLITNYIRKITFINLEYISSFLLLLALGLFYMIKMRKKIPK
ncbi:spore germination protein [Metabacillus sp. RGM 3146]|uniref:spore germination protein n=1 Tax=Metabacillus sp. RGM 3146 TaxID=3401092 RepID=UPI003B9DA0A5